MASKSSKLVLNTFLFEDIHVGDTYSFDRLIDAKLVTSFAQLSGDYNPLHMDEHYATTTPFQGRIVHGMLMASFFSALVGMLIPGLHCLYLSQEARFKKPVHLNTRVTVIGTVVEVSRATRMVVIKTIIRDPQKIIVVEGEAKVKVGYEKI